MSRNHCLSMSDTDRKDNCSRRTTTDNMQDSKKAGMLDTDSMAEQLAVDIASQRNIDN